MLYVCHAAAAIGRRACRPVILLASVLVLKSVGLVVRTYHCAIRQENPMEGLLSRMGVVGVYIKRRVRGWDRRGKVGDGG